MPYLICPSCRLSLSVDEYAAPLPDCPRCLRRHGKPVEMSLARGPRRMLRRDLHELTDAVIEARHTRQRLA